MQKLEMEPESSLKYNREQGVASSRAHQGTTEIRTNNASGLIKKAAPEGHRARTTARK